jgi:soluble lytic murein transglycosylase-like protein
MCVLLASVAMAQTVPPPKPAPPGTPPAIPAPADPTRAAATPAPETPPPVRSPAELMQAAIATQKDAVRKQAQAAGATLIPWSPAPDAGAPEADCDPIADKVVAPLIENAAKANALTVKLVRAVIEQESAFRPCAVSSKGAQGLMQLMPDTASKLSVKDVFDPQQNIEGGAKYLKQLLDKYKGDNKLALAAFNAGPAAVDAAAGVPDIPETRDYVDAILKKIQ